MNTLASSTLTAVILCVGVGTVRAADSDNDATPTVDERLMETLAQGTLMRIGKEYVWVMEKEGTEIKLYVDKSTTKQGKRQVPSKSKSNKTAKDTQQR